MKNEVINIDNIIRYWTESSDNDYQTMLDLYKTKHFHWSLFLGHLVIEKLSKAVYVKEKENYPPLIHDLRRLLEKSNIKLTEKQIVKLDTISRFNINARYDDYKQRFYNLCTEDFTSKWVNEINIIREWIKSMLLK